MKIRRGKKEDIPALVELIRSFWAEADYTARYGVAEDPETIAAVLTYALEGGVVQVAEDDEIVGLIVLLVAPSPFNKDYLCATDYVYYLKKDARGKGLGPRLLKQAELVCKQIGVQMLNMVHLTSVAPERAGAAYEKAGYNQTEVLYSKEIS